MSTALLVVSCRAELMESHSTRRNEKRQRDNVRSAVCLVKGRRRETVQSLASARSASSNSSDSVEVRAVRAVAPCLRDRPRENGHPLSKTQRTKMCVINDKMTAADHVSSLLASCSRSLYAMRVLRDHGLPVSSLQDVFRAAVIAKLTYCAWH